MKPRSVLIVLALTFVGDGILEAYVGGQSARALFFAHALAIGVLCYVWCRADAIFRGIALPSRWVTLLAGLFPLIGVPVYLFRSRSGRAAWVATAKALVFVVAISALGALTTEAISAVRT